MPKKGNRKRLKFRAEDVCSESVTVADYADSDPAIVKSGRVKKAVANAIEKEVKLLRGLEASHGPVQDVLSSVASVSGANCDSSDEPDPEDCVKGSRKKKNKRRKENGDCCDGEEYPVDIWLVLASYIRPEDICTFALICKNAWTVTCTAAFWTRLYRRYYSLDADLPLRLQPDCMGKMRCLRACVIRSLFHLYEPFSARISKTPMLPEATPTCLLNSKCLLFWVNKIVGSRPSSPMWEFNFKFLKQVWVWAWGSGFGVRGSGFRRLFFQPQLKRQHRLQLQQTVHINRPAELLQVTPSLSSPVGGMTLSRFTISVSTDMRHHRVGLAFQDSPVLRGRSLRGDPGVQVVLDPVHSVRLIDWWHPQYPTSAKT
ncbi:transmembrane protein 183A [Anguilla rostrata]|uniref:transmembrane protein 183A n=1 Tax=Anguilla rostrata TaxID=7938 RepID=UPI0030D4F8A7